MSEKILIGTKFYKVTKSKVPVIIRLKKQNNSILEFNMGGYITYLSQDEIESMISANEFTHIGREVWVRDIDYFGSSIEQEWVILSNHTDKFVKFKVSNIVVKMSIEELKDNYTRLIPDGFFTISNLEYPINNGKEKGFDVLITLNKFGDSIPYIICRQDTVDVFAFSNDNKNIPIGISIPRESCPKNMNYLDFMYSETCSNFKSTAVYLDDSLDTILSYIGSLNKYNNTMKKLKYKYENTQMTGCRNNVRELLTSTGFFSDFKSVFGIFSFPFALDLNRSDFNDKEMTLLNKIINSKANSTFIDASYCPYDKGIDMDSLGFNHLLIDISSTTNPDIFLVAYNELGTK